VDFYTKFITSSQQIERMEFVLYEVRGAVQNYPFMRYKMPMYCIDPENQTFVACILHGTTISLKPSRTTRMQKVWDIPVDQTYAL